MLQAFSYQPSGSMNLTAKVLANKDPVLETYRAILHRGLNISDERRLDVEARVFNPRRAKSEKNILGALQEWRSDQMCWHKPATCTPTGS